MIGVNLFLVVIKEVKPMEMKAKLKFMLAYTWLTPILFVCIMAPIADIGPLGLYCWVRCDEYGIDKQFTSDGACWTRLAVCI